MWEFLKNLKDFLSLDYRSLFILTGISWIIIFFPSNKWQDFGLYNLWYQFRPAVFIIGLISTIWLIFGSLYDLINNSVKIGQCYEKSKENMKN